MDLFEALYTTRAMRRVRPDPIPHDVQAAIMDAAIRAPSGGNQQNWRFLLVDDPAVKTALAPHYKTAIDQLWTTIYAADVAAAEADPGSAESIQFVKVQRSAQHLGEHFAEAPLLLFAFAQHDPTGGSIYPAVWNAMLAARAYGVGSCITAVLGFFAAEETAEILGVPADEGWVNACCVTFGYPTGRWDVAARRPVHQVTFRNQWATAPGFEVDAPLWSPPA